MFHSIITRNFKIFILSFVIFPNITFALSVTTANTIQGTKPQLKSLTNNLPLTFNNVKDIVHFQVPDDANGYKTYYGDTSTLSKLNTTYFPRTLKYSDFDPNSWDNNLFYDDDGDTRNTNLTITPELGETINATYPFIGYDSVNTIWKDKNNNIINYGENDTLDPCRSPYQLTITYTKLRVHSQYGDPSVSVIDNDINNGTALSQTFTINVQPYICYLKPANMSWANWEGSPEAPQEKIGYAPYSPPTNSANFGGGYDATQFDPEKGFIANQSGDKFPTIAFKNAKFDIVMSSDAIPYTFTINPNHYIDISGKTATFTNKSNSYPIKFTIEGSAPGYPTITYEFSVKSWATPLTKSQTQSPTITWVSFYCKELSHVFVPAELTNIPLTSWANINDNPVSNAVYTRKIGTLSGEWGKMNQDDYPDSNWNDTFYWTKTKMTGGDASTKDKYWLWNPYWGKLQVQGASEVTINGNPYVVCKN